MNTARQADVVVLGGGPAGLSAALAVRSRGAVPLIIEREERLGGILKQCIHDGFGLVRYGRSLTGPEYARRDLAVVRSSGIETMVQTFVSSIVRHEGLFTLQCVHEGGIEEIKTGALVLATGCRERTDRQVFIHGDRPAGIFTAGLAQYLVNVKGWIPGRRAIVLGSGDIGLIMARRLTLEGIEVLGVHEIKHEPSGLQRNIRQCLQDFNIPLRLGSTVTAVHGRNRVTAVTVADTDEALHPIAASARELVCDSVILSVGLIPENELALSLGVPVDPVTKGPFIDQGMHTLVDGIFACGNCVHVADLVDHVSESGSLAGANAASYALGERHRRTLVPVVAQGPLAYVVPQYIDVASAQARADCFFRVRRTMAHGGTLQTGFGTEILMRERYDALRPPEMQRFGIGWGALEMTAKQADSCSVCLEEAVDGQ
jgi:thioredoxin reductase